jgi:hypothetical protein
MTKSTKVAKQPARKKTSGTSKKNAAVLATCPVGSAGWCAYPFSVAQLQKRMKRIADGGKTADDMALSGHSAR